MSGSTSYNNFSLFRPSPGYTNETVFSEDGTFYQPGVTFALGPVGLSSGNYEALCRWCNDKTFLMNPTNIPNKLSACGPLGASNFVQNFSDKDLALLVFPGGGYNMQKVASLSNISRSIGTPLVVPRGQSVQKKLAPADINFCCQLEQGEPIVVSGAELAGWTNKSLVVTKIGQQLVYETMFKGSGRTSNQADLVNGTDETLTVYMSQVPQVASNAEKEKIINQGYDFGAENLHAYYVNPGCDAAMPLSAVNTFVLAAPLTNQGIDGCLQNGLLLFDTPHEIVAVISMEYGRVLTITKDGQLFGTVVKKLNSRIICGNNIINTQGSIDN